MTRRSKNMPFKLKKNASLDRSFSFHWPASHILNAFCVNRPLEGSCLCSEFGIELSLSLYTETIFRLLMIIFLCIRSLRYIRHGCRRAAPGGFDRRSSRSHHAPEAGGQLALPQTPAASAWPPHPQQPALRQTPRLPHWPLRTERDNRQTYLRSSTRGQSRDSGCSSCTNKPCIIQDELRTYTDTSDLLHHVKLFQCNIRSL